MRDFVWEILWAVIDFLTTLPHPEEDIRRSLLWLCFWITLLAVALWFFL